MILFILFCILVLIIFVSWLNLIRDSKKTNISGPLPLPILGNGHLFLVESAKFLSVLSQLAEEYGDALRAYILSSRYVVLSHPKYVEGVISSTELITKGKSYSTFVPWLGQGLLTASGQRWKTHRKFLTPAFHFNILQTFLPIFTKNDKILIKKLQMLADGTSDINLFPIIALNALDNVIESIMGVSINAQEDNESAYVKAIEDLSYILALRIRIPLLSSETIFGLTHYKKKQDKILEYLHGHTKKVIELRRKELQKFNITDSKYSSEFGSKDRRAFLDLLLLGEINGKKLDNESIREEVDTFMFEGHDTTSSGIVYCLYNISTHKDVQDKLWTEQKSIFGEDMKRDPTYNELQQMKYLELVIKESLRLYPSVPLIERLTTKDTDISGLHIPKNTSIVINIFRMQRHPDVFEDPLDFRPERFATNSLKNVYSWIAFSAGPRNCIGQKFAMMEMKVVVSAIIRHFKILPSDIKVEKLNSDLILRSPDGVHIKLLPRSY